MSDVSANEPQTDREFMMEIKGELKTLTQAIDRLGNVLDKIESKRIEPIEKRLDDIEEWQHSMNGTWKAIVAISLVVSTVGVLIQIFHR